MEFEARSTGDPREECLIESDAAVDLPGIAFPSSRPHVMLWPSAPSGKRPRLPMSSVASEGCVVTAFHGTGTNLARLDEAEYGVRALADRDLALYVARHKSVFFR